jgi:hypothetical protein
MLSRSLVLAALVLTPLFAAGCSAETDDDAAKESGASDNALTAGIAEGTKLTTTARLNFRTQPSTSATIIRVMPVGTVVTALGESKNGFLHVSTNGDDGWAYSTYLKSNGASAPSAPSTGSTGGHTTTPLPSDSSNDSAQGVGAVQTCKASFYDEGQQTANGERFDPNALTAAHKTLPFNTRIRVTNEANGKSVVVRINDRGPFVAGRCLDLSRAAFEAIASTSAGVATVDFQVVN